MNQSEATQKNDGVPSSDVRCDSPSFVHAIRTRGKGSHIDILLRLVLPRPLSLLKGVFVILGAMFAFGLAEFHSVWGAYAPETYSWSGPVPVKWLAGRAMFASAVLIIVVAQCNAHLDAILDFRCHKDSTVDDSACIQRHRLGALVRVILIPGALLLADGWDFLNRLALLAAAMLLLWWGKTMRLVRTKEQNAWSELVGSVPQIGQGVPDAKAAMAHIRPMTMRMRLLVGLEAPLLLLGGFTTTYPFAHPTFLDGVKALLENADIGFTTVKVLALALLAAYLADLVAVRLVWTLQTVREHRFGAERWYDYSEAHLAYLSFRLGDSIAADRPLLAGIGTPAYLIGPAVGFSLVILFLLRRYVAGPVILALVLMVLFASVGSLSKSPSTTIGLALVVAVVFYRWLFFPLMPALFNPDLTSLSPAVTLEVSYVLLWTLFFGARFVDARFICARSPVGRGIVDQLACALAASLGAGEGVGAQENPEREGVSRSDKETTPGKEAR